MAICSTESTKTKLEITLSFAGPFGKLLSRSCVNWRHRDHLESLSMESKEARAL